ncbi:hypothetical protein BJ875DRAFT_71466 [Amylocarpus encephaloides]|uniref:Uncharacterized protein n=1 Tax=Amylocarpus encephaloides TaxID=45428 RepID=A0A9P7YGA3_9HELO|nr:hypothetical protein BJ875DRAFT_71466 [Amylocarpus encephaloides]
MEPPSAPPPPPPPLNIQPSRARRQLEARLKLHKQQKAENNENGDQAEKLPPRKILNPFAADEDDDSDNEDGPFTIGDLEADEEGRGHLPTGTGLVGSDASLLDVGKNSSTDSEDSDDEGYGGNMGFDGIGGGKRRLSVTTEAKRRTILEDDDDDEVVHVAMVEPEALKETFPEKPGQADGDDGELVEIQHAEMQGVEVGAQK